MFKKFPIWLTAPVLFLAVVFIICVGGWLVWFNTRPVYNHDFWYSVTSEPPEFILYLFAATPQNAVRALRDGLMNELAHSGQLPHGYPKLRNVPWVNNAPSCQYKNVVVEERYYIQLTETVDNYIELPLCPRTVMSYSLVINILPALPWAQVSYDTPQIFIDMNRSGNPEKQHLLKPGQEDLILKSLENIGVKVYQDEHFQTLLRNRK